MRQGTFELEVLVHGRPVREYVMNDKTYFEGRTRQEFSIRVRNNSHRRAVAVVSVDGLSVMNGKVASKEHSGYVIDAYSSVVIPGWRLNDHDVANFFFAALPEAYASQMGKPDNIGVIGAAFFFERQKMQMETQFLGSKSVGAGCRGGIGTGFGRRTEHHVTRVEFDREKDPDVILKLNYDEPEALERLGITIEGAHCCSTASVVEARPFPADDGCPVPKGWKG